MGTQKTDILRYKVDQEKLWGIYRGVVEDRYDPLRLGRVRIRVWGVHTEEQAGDLNQVPYDELVWAHPVLSTFGGSISDVGGWYIPLQGSHVFVFFENGNMMQPRYFATAPGFPIDGAKFSQLEKQDGYKDPDDVYPLVDHIEEHDWHRLARVMKLDKTYRQLKEDNLDLGVDVAFGGTWDEQPPMYETEYPHGNVWATEEEYDKNQVVELDGTPGKQRVQYWHPSKSYFEINKDGRFVIRNAWHRWDICDKDKHMHTKANVFEKIDGGKTCKVDDSEWREVTSNRWTRIDETNWYEDTDQYHWDYGSYKRFILGDRHLILTGKDMALSIGKREITSIGKTLIATLSSMEIFSTAVMKIVSTGGRKASIVGTDSVLTTGDILHTAGTFMHCKGSGGSFRAEGATDASLKGGARALVGAPYVGVGGGTVQIGPIVQLGVMPAPALPAATAPGVAISPSIPDIPPFSDPPPVPEIPPEFPPPEIEVEMPEPGC